MPTGRIAAPKPPPLHQEHAMAGTILKRIAYSIVGALWAAFTAAFA